MVTKQIAGKPERYYVKNGKLIANSDYDPQVVVVNAPEDLLSVIDELEPGAIGHVVGTKVDYELNADNTWIGRSGNPLVEMPEDETDVSKVIFIDYDGTVVAQYDKPVFMEMTELPQNPSHKDLVAQGWNWELDRIKYYLDKYDGCVLTVGQMYCTADGATHIHLNVQGRLTVPLMFQQSVENGVTLDWGDGSPKETVAGTGVVTTEHTYAVEGEYVLKMKAATGCEMNFGDEENNLNIFGENRTRKYGFFITKICFSEDITNIGNDAFCGCCALKFLIIPEGVTSVLLYGFANCYNLQSLVIPEGVTSIGNNAFANCYNLQSLVIPEGVTSIEEYAFANCNNLQSLVIPEGVTSIPLYGFSNCYNLQSLVIPEGVTSIGQYAFSSCYDLQSLVIPEEVTSIPVYGFTSCYNLQSLVIPEGVTSIEEYAFANCNNLQSLVIPEGVTSIGQYGISGGYNLQSLVIISETPPTLSNVYAFRNLPSDCIIYVPYSEDHSILETYKTATNWSTWAEQMVESEPDESEGTDDSVEPGSEEVEESNP